MRSVKLAVSAILAMSLVTVAPALAGGKKDNGPSAPGGSPGNGNSGNGNSGNGNSGNGNSGNGNSGNGNSGGSGGGGVVVITPPVATCGLSDLSIVAAACGGFFQGNLLSNSASDVAAQTIALAAVGLSAWDGSIAEPQLNLSTASVNFATGLYGLTFVGIHFGAGGDSPSPHTSGGVTGFYRFDAGTNLDVFNLAFGSASSARLFVTQAAPPPVVPEPPVQLPLPFDPPAQSALGAIPEPATWLMMIAGFGCVGSILRARRRAIAA